MKTTQMLTLRTELNIEPNPDKIGFNSHVLAIGSGFTQSVTNNFKKYRLSVKNNPYGTIYNPISIFNLIDISINDKPIDEDLIIEENGVWNHYDFHSTAGASSKEELMSNIQEVIEETRKYLKSTNFLIITFGTAYVYRLVSNGHIVANCHSTSNNTFDKQLLSPYEIVESFRRIYKSLNHIRNIIFMVSPVMHTKDTLTLNTVSKSSLRLATHFIMSEFPYVKYFPAYELLTSELRDYRFYKDDLLHPTSTAISYIFQRFVETYVSEEDQKLIEEIEDILDKLAHQPYNPQSEASRKEMEDGLNIIKEHNNRCDLSEVIRMLEGKLAQNKTYE